MIMESSKVQLIDIAKIHILNPRARNQKTFLDITTNISQVGLKRPITVTPCRSGTPGKAYDLVCGQGRLEAFQACGQAQIPAIVIDATEEQALIMSLVENLARRNARPIEHLQAIEILSRKGYSNSEIEKKTGLNKWYIGDVVRLLKNGEERLLSAVEAGKIPVYLAIRIAENPQDEQGVLQEAYESNLLRGNRLLFVKKLVERRHRHGKSFVSPGKRKHVRTEKKILVQDVMKAFQMEMDRKRLLVRKADRVNSNLLFVTEALRRLLQNENFNTLLRAEGFLTLPRPIAAIINGIDPDVHA